jgi:hypothetical protein
MNSHTFFGWQSKIPAGSAPLAKSFHRHLMTQQNQHPDAHPIPKTYPNFYLMSKKKMNHDSKKIISKRIERGSNT